MKKIVALFLLVIVVFVLTGCRLTPEVELLYSRSYANSHDFDEIHEVITTYHDYVDTGYDLDLDADFFMRNVLYTYAFTYSVMGTDIFVMNDYDMRGDTLFINCEMNDSVIVLDAFGEYAMIFSINRNIYNQAEDIKIDLFGQKELIFDSQEHFYLIGFDILYYIDIEEASYIAVSFTEDTITPALGIVYLLYDEEGNMLELNPHYGTQGFSVELSPGSYILSLNIVELPYTGNSFYYHAVVVDPPGE